MFVSDVSIVQGAQVDICSCYKPERGNKVWTRIIPLARSMFLKLHYFRINLVLCQHFPSSLPQHSLTKSEPWPSCYVCCGLFKCLHQYRSRSVIFFLNKSSSGCYEWQQVKTLLGTGLFSLLVCNFIPLHFLSRFLYFKCKKYQEKYQKKL